MANKTIYPYGVGGQTPSGIDIVDDLTTGGANQALSAEQGKILGEMLLGGRGTFADAYDKAIENSTHFFPWLLEDVDENGDSIKKMIWHIGNKRFIDAIGAEINGTKNGITITSDEDGVLLFKKVAGDTNASELPFSAGDTSYGFKEIANIWKSTDGNSDDTYNGKTFIITGITGNATTMKFRLGWATVNSFADSVMSKATEVLEWNVSNASLREKMYSSSSPNTKLEVVQISGSLAGVTGANSSASTYRMFGYCNALRKADFKNLMFNEHGTSIVKSLEGFLGASNNYNYSLTYVDIRGFDTSNVRDFGALFGRKGLQTLIIGDLNTKAYTSGNFMANSTGVTLVCTSDTPPDISNYNYLSGKVSKIKVPNKTVEVGGEDVTVLSLYQAATGWSSFTGTWETYEVGEY